MSKGHRTLLIALAGLGSLLGGASIVNNEKMYDSLMWGVVLIVLSIATRSGVEALAGGGGAKGAFKALMTDAKPDTKEPTP